VLDAILFGLLLDAIFLIVLLIIRLKKVGLPKAVPGASIFLALVGMVSVAGSPAATIAVVNAAVFDEDKRAADNIGSKKSDDESREASGCGRSKLLSTIVFWSATTIAAAGLIIAGLSAYADAKYRHGALQLAHFSILIWFLGLVIRYMLRPNARERSQRSKGPCDDRDSKTFGRERSST
jgi:hypothetical protein